MEVVKRLWAYIKENNLQDPTDKRFIVCDEKLMGIFKHDRIHSFTMNKYLTEHLRKKEDLKNGTNGMNNNGSSIAEHDELNDDEIKLEEETYNLDEYEEGEINNVKAEEIKEEGVPERIQQEGLIEGPEDIQEGGPENVNGGQEVQESGQDWDDRELFGDDDADWEKEEEEGEE